MTTSDLQDAIIAELKKIFSGYHLPDSKGNMTEINIFAQDAPVRKSVSSTPLIETDEDSEEEMLEVYDFDSPAEEPYPYVIVRVQEGTQEGPDEAERVTVYLLIGVYCESDEYYHVETVELVDGTAKLSEADATAALITVKGAETSKVYDATLEDGIITVESPDESDTAVYVTYKTSDYYSRKGSKDVLNIIQKVKNRFNKNHILDKHYIFDYPLKWTTQDEDTHPYYFGGMEMVFEVPVTRREMTNLI